MGDTAILGGGSGGDRATGDARRHPLSRAAALAALGIVYGDLGTSPLYTMTAVLGAVRTPDAVAALGVLSLIVWALIITVSVKYCLLAMRADNHGEGGILALMALLGVGQDKAGHRRRWGLAAAGLFGAALIYGDGVITPAISVLSAVEGTTVATSVLKPFVLPAAALILLALFAVQPRGTARIGRVFGPVMLAWFLVAALLGALAARRHPEVIAALNPLLALRLLGRSGWHAFPVLGGVFLAITGAEALYADMGHIGRRPIRLCWYGIVLPALVLNYAGQTAWLIDHPGGTDSPFFRLAPGWAVLPLVVLATAATVIASQAIITGAFSLTRQAMQLGWMPGVLIRQTSDEAYGQIYVPLVNWAMMGLTLLLALSFGSSDRLAGAYGTAVSTTMLLTTVLLYGAMRQRWGWPLPAAAAAAGLFLIVDAAFAGANLLKIVEGGWIPLAIAAVLFVVMTTWREGTEAVRRQAARLAEAPERFLARLKQGRVPRTQGVAVFLTRNERPVPALMVRHVAEFGALPADLVSLTVRFAPIPRVPVARRVEVEAVADRFWHVTAHWGFVEVPDIASALACAEREGVTVAFAQALFFAAHDQVVAGRGPGGMAGWRKRLFAFLYRNAVRSVDTFHLPGDRYVEIGRQIAL